MSPIIIAVIAILIISIIIATMIKYAVNQNLMCPYCHLEFRADLFLIQGNALLICPFCKRWILVTQSFDRYIVKKLFA